MSPKASLKSALKEVQDDLSALQTDLPKIESLLEQHTQAVDEAKRDGAPYETLAELQAKRSGFESVLNQHRRDIAEAERRVSELQAESEVEDSLAVIARASVKRTEVEAAMSKLFAETDRVLLAAVSKARELATEGNEHLGLAESALKHILALRGHKDDSYARASILKEAVLGTDVRPLNNGEPRFSEWPTDWHGSPYEAIKHVEPDRISSLPG